ncbi:hypothetical protein GY45DRAFT_1239049 [Cubamyces sp. BRFM 1775]|nr:hypothetical protein GY45DRAFT_1239049 [Cubamyces sp. BRFM 1775]
MSNGTNVLSPALLLDVFTFVMTYCNLPTISRLMRTCSTLYGRGSTVLLNARRSLKSEDAVVSFCLFMAAENGARYSSLRSLRFQPVHYDTIPKDTGRHLQRLFYRLKALEELTLYGIDDLLESYPTLSNAIVGFTTLKHVDLVGARHYASKNVAPYIRSPLVSIEYGFSPEGFLEFLETLSTQELIRYHPVRMFSRFASTLEILKTDYFARKGLNRRIRSKVYPVMRDLELMDAWPVTRPWIDAFPALRRIRNVTMCTGEPPDHGEDRGRGIRQRNIEDQQTNGSWASLEESSGTLFGIYGLGLICPVERVVLYHISMGWHGEMLIDVLAMAQPVDVDLTIQEELVRVDVEEGIPPTLRRHSAQLMSIRKLAFRVLVKEEDFDSDVEPCPSCPRNILLNMVPIFCA